MNIRLVTVIASLFLAAVVARGGETEWMQHIEAAERAIKGKDLEKAYKEYEAAETEAEDMADARRQALAVHGLGDVRLRQGKYDLAEAQLSKALKIGEKAWGLDDPVLMYMLMDLSRAYAGLKQDDKVETPLRRAIELAQATPDGKSEVLPRLLLMLGHFQLQHHQIDEAEKLFKQALALDEQNAGEDSAQAALSRASIAQILDEQGKFEEALALLAKSRSAVEKDEKFAPVLVEVLQLQARILSMTGQFDKAIEAADRMVKADPDNGGVYRTRALVWFDKGDMDKSLADFRKALELDPKGEHADYGQLWVWLLRYKLGEKQAAAKDFQAYMDKRMPDDNAWFPCLAKFAVGQMTEDELFKSAKSTNRKISREQECEAFFYAGEMRLINGEKQKATELMKRCMETGVTEFIEHRAARAELGRARPN